MNLRTKREMHLWTSSKTDFFDRLAHAISTPSSPGYCKIKWSDVEERLREYLKLRAFSYVATTLGFPVWQYWVSNSGGASENDRVGIFGLFLQRCPISPRRP